MPKRRASAARAPSILVAAALLLGAAGCAAEPEETIESLSALTEAGEQSSIVSEWSREHTPQPIVAPLPCTPYLVLTARGTAEPSKGQLLSPVARAISNSRPGQVQAIDLDYPADDDVNEGGTLGARLLIDTLNLQTATCSTQRFILLGYSQGALIVGDALSAPEHRLVGSEVGELTGAAEDRVLAIVMYGDPRFNASEPYNLGDFDDRLSGLLPRLTGSLSHFDDRIRDYCAATDFVCQRRGFELDPEGHMAYYDNGMQQDGAAFVIGRLDPLSINADESDSTDDSLDGAQ